MVLTTIYCEARTCKYHNGFGCSADFTTISSSGECLGFEENKVKGQDKNE